MNDENDILEYDFEEDILDPDIDKDTEIANEATFLIGSTTRFGRAIKFNSKFF